MAKPLTKEAIDLFRQTRKRTKLSPVLIHANYLINLAAADELLLAKSIASFREEIERALLLGVDHLVVHPGSARGACETDGIETCALSLNAACKGLTLGRFSILLENTAGQGECIGHRFEHLASITANVREPERLCVCLDTAHLFAAGYDMSSEDSARKTLREFDRVIGRDRLVAIHLNDSKTARGSRVDRHEHIGKGRIGLDAFRFFMCDRRFRKIPKVLETPKGKELREDVMNLKTLRTLAGKQ